MLNGLNYNDKFFFLLADKTNDEEKIRITHNDQCILQNDVNDLFLSLFLWKFNFDVFFLVSSS